MGYFQVVIFLITQVEREAGLYSGTRVGNVRLKQCMVVYYHVCVIIYQMVTMANSLSQVLFLKCVFFAL